MLRVGVECYYSEFAIDAILSWSQQVHDFEATGDGSIQVQQDFLGRQCRADQNDTDCNWVKKKLYNEGREPAGPYHTVPENT